MRVNLRKLIIICGTCVLLWLAVSYSAMVVSPYKPRSSILDLEAEINRLEQKMQDQLSDSYKILEKVRKHLKKTEEKEVEESEQNSQSNANKDEMQYKNPVLPVLVIACDRVTVRRCLDNLVKFRPNKETFPIIISQDCGHNDTYQVIKSFTESDPTITVVRQPDLSEIPLPRAKVKFKGYYKIARHYKFALNYVFQHLNHDAVIIVEDDLDISPDFFEYFLGTYPLLFKDPTIWCISAWNDNGKKELIDLKQPELLHRTDFFPGLGWLLRKESWLQLEPKWPQAFFDDWLRDPKNTNGRACIRPEISRTYSFGKVGVSKGLFFDMHLRYMQLNTQFVEFTRRNLSYLEKAAYDAALERLVAALPQVSAEEVVEGARPEPALRVPYSGALSFQKAAKRIGLMDDFRSGIPRTAYRGVVTCSRRGRRVYLAPASPWKGYDPAWG